MRVLFCSLLLLVGATAHGTLTIPMSRALRASSSGAGSTGVALAGGCPSSSCQWYTQRTVTQNTTNCRRSDRTMGVSCASESNPIDYPCTPSNQGVPWCSPGAAPVHSPCGVFAGGDGGMNGRNMLDLDGTPQAKWTRGGTADVGFSIIANHGGGYAYRLCPVATGARDVDGRLDESCFAAHHLNFSAAHPETTVLDTVGKTVASFPAVRVRGGSPAGAQWTRNPVALEAGMSPPIPALPALTGRGPFPFTISDSVDVPIEFAAGHYVLSWRWDAEQTKQVWSHCSDVLLVDPATEATDAEGALFISFVCFDSFVCTSTLLFAHLFFVHCAATAERKPTGAEYAAKARVLAGGDDRRTPCTGASLGLDVGDCAAWIELYDALGGAHWVDEAGKSLAHMRLDPCSVNQYWKKKIVCVQYRGYLTLTELYLMGRDLDGTLPGTIAQLSHLRVLSIVSSNVAGVVPQALGEIPTLEMLWLDHNQNLGGTIPSSLSKLSLSVFEMHYSNFSGVLPALDYLSIPDCMLYNDRFNATRVQLAAVEGGNNMFACPLPPGAATCGAVCA